MSPTDISLVATNVQAILELAADRLAVNDPLEPHDAFQVEVTLRVAIQLLDPLHDNAVAADAADDLVKTLVRDAKK